MSSFEEPAHGELRSNLPPKFPVPGQVKPMAPAEFQAIRLDLGMEGFPVPYWIMAKALGVANDRTVRRWAHGESGIPGPAAKLLRAWRREGKIW